MSVPRPPSRRPSLDDRLAAWTRAYHVVLEEIRASVPDRGPDLFTRLQAAEIAADLVRGADADNAGSH